MRTVKLVSALIALLALTAIATATATAAETLWTWLAGATGEDYTNGSKEAKLEIKGGGGSITCTKSKSTGVITAEQSLGLTTIDFEGCKAEGIAAVNSLGDAKETILTHVETHNCIIAKEPKLLGGILFKPLPLHLEIPLTSELILVEGSFVGEVTPIKTKAKKFELIITQKAGVQGIPKCEGGSEEFLTSEKNESGKKIQSGEGVVGGFIEFLLEQESMA